MKTIKLIALVVLISTLNFSCKESKGDEPGTTQVVNFKAPENYKNVTIKNTYQVSIPDYMTEDNTLNDVASLQYANAKKGMYIIIIDESKEVFENTAKKTDIYDFRMSSLENYRKAQLADLDTKVIKLHREKPEIMSIDGVNAEFVITDAKAPQHDKAISFFHTFLEHGDNLYMAMGWTAQSQKLKFKDDVKNIIKSFKIINK